VKKRGNQQLFGLLTNIFTPFETLHKFVLLWCTGRAGFKRIWPVSSNRAPRQKGAN